MDFTSNQTTEEIFDPEAFQLEVNKIVKMSLLIDQPEDSRCCCKSSSTCCRFTSGSPETGEPAEFKQRSSSNVKNYEVSKKLSTTVGQIGKIKKVKTAVLVKNKMVETPEGTVSQPISDEDKEKITSLVKEAVGFNEDREGYYRSY